VEWNVIRAHYDALWTAARDGHGLTQERIAAAGGLSGQNALSRLLANTKRGPSVETFIRAIEGLGLRQSEFFAALETTPASPTTRRPDGGTTPAVSDPESLQRQIVETTIREVFAGLACLLARPGAGMGAPAPTRSPDPAHAPRRRAAHRRRVRKSA